MLVFNYGIDDITLNPCPVCGYSGVILRSDVHGFSVQCTDCCEETDCYKVPEMAAYEWSQIKKENYENPNEKI